MADEVTLMEGPAKSVLNEGEKKCPTSKKDEIIDDFNNNALQAKGSNLFYFLLLSLIGCKIYSFFF